MTLLNLYNSGLKFGDTTNTVSNEYIHDNDDFNDDDFAPEVSDSYYEESPVLTAIEQCIWVHVRFGHICTNT